MKVVKNKSSSFCLCNYLPKSVLMYHTLCELDKKGRCENEDHVHSIIAIRYGAICPVCHTEKIYLCKHPPRPIQYPPLNWWEAS